MGIFTNDEAQVVVNLSTSVLADLASIADEEGAALGTLIGDLLTEALDAREAKAAEEAEDSDEEDDLDDDEDEDRK